MMALTEKETISCRHSGPRAGIYREAGPGNSNSRVFDRFRVKPGMTVIVKPGMTDIVKLEMTEMNEIL